MPPRSPCLPGTSYKKTIEYLYGLERLGIKMDLAPVREILSRLGEPQKSFPAVHVGGSNGKGSTSAMVESILTKAGYRVGLYTSPHLVRFNERIRVGGRDIPNRTVADLVQRIALIVERKGARTVSPTFFEFTTAMAFLYFAESDIDVAVVEVGMGGRLDATNVVTPLVSIITNITREHERILGSGVRAIAREKAGIVRRGVPLVTAAKGVPVTVFKDICHDRSAPLYIKGRDFNVREVNGGFDFIRNGSRHSGLKSALEGPHQFSNAACAIMAVELLKEKGYDVDASAVRRGLGSVRWPGRLEKVQERPVIVVDCAHNPAGAEALKSALEGIRYNRLILVVGVMADKDVRGIVSRLVPLADHIIVTRARTERAATVETLYRVVLPYGKPVETVEGVASACQAALAKAEDDDLVCVTGSVYTVGEARDFVMNEGARG